MVVSLYKLSVLNICFFFSPYERMFAFIFFFYQNRLINKCARKKKSRSFLDIEELMFLAIYLEFELTEDFLRLLSSDLLFFSSTFSSSSAHLFSSFSLTQYFMYFQPLEKRLFLDLC